jgi:guanylate kinase
MSSSGLSLRRRGTGSGLAFVVSGPSGAGKNTAINGLIAQVPDLVYSVSHTTRVPRPGERDGVDYHFVSSADFDKMVETEQFIEHVIYLGDQYGTSKGEMARLAAKGLDIVLNIDAQGACTLRREGVPGVALAFVFFSPPSIDQLGERLRARGSESEAAIAERLRVASREIETLPVFDYLVINDTIENAVRELSAIVEAERLRVLSVESNA